MLDDEERLELKRFDDVLESLKMKTGAVFHEIAPVAYHVAAKSFVVDFDVEDRNDAPRREEFADHEVGNEIASEN